MRDKLTNILNAKIEQRKTLSESIIEAETKEERSAINETIIAIDKEIEELRGMIEDIDAPVEPTAEPRNLEPVGTELRGAGMNPTIVGYEERMAFKNYIATGERRDGPAGDTKNDASSIIPENLLNQIIEKLETVGTIYQLVTKTAYPVGQTIPVEATRPVATWVGRNTTTLSSSTSGEGYGSTAQKGVQFTTAISFTNFKLRCEVAMTEEVADMALPAFEALFVKNVSTAMLRAIEFAIVDGDGYGQPTGITNGWASETKKVEVAKTAGLEWATLCEAEALLPLEYENGAKWCMTKKTFMKFVGMVDDNGQPIARINYGMTGRPERTLLGREVILYTPQTGSNLGSYADTVTNNTLFAFLFDFDDYVLNNNYNLGIQHKVDWDNEDHRTKAVACYDGKPIRKDSFVVLVKKSS